MMGVATAGRVAVSEKVNFVACECSMVWLRSDFDQRLELNALSQMNHGLEHVPPHPLLAPHRVDNFEH
jgi:hypothetical protein